MTPAVLIPRPETEELVQLVIDFIGERTDAHLLDACTGSGCIALALARNLRFAEITAIDISGEALAVARENACNLKADVNFLQADALKMSGLPGQPWDAIVSNPPYITPSEKGAMERNVLEYEPQQALFVPENEPLKFYEAIARYGLGTLKQQGGIFFEINPLYASALVELMQSLGYEEVALSRDMFGKERFLTAKNRRNGEDPEAYGL